VLFPFGYGLSYTTFKYSDLKLTPAEKLSVTFTVKNTGNRAGTEIAEVYAGLPSSSGEPPKRLVGWERVELKAGESKDVSVQIEPLFLSAFDPQQHAWKKSAGEYTILVGGSSANLPLHQALALQ